MMMRTKKTWVVILNGRPWYTGIRSEAKADAEAIRCRQLGLGMAYVEIETITR